jgi:hypothetical protein
MHFNYFAMVVTRTALKALLDIAIAIQACKAWTALEQLVVAVA